MARHFLIGDKLNGNIDEIKNKNKNAISRMISAHSEGALLSPSRICIIPS